MRKLKIYLDTTIPSYVFNSHVPDKQIAAKKLFEYIDQERFEAYISAAVMREILNTKDKDLRNQIILLVKTLKVLEVSSECIGLAEEYIKRDIIPRENIDDAIHIACASIYEIDFLISYNFENIVKIKTIDNVQAVNLLLGYRSPRIIIPEEVIDV